MVIIKINRVTMITTKTCKVFININFLTDYFSLPKLTKPEIDSIMKELSNDMENIWTPSKLV